MGATAIEQARRWIDVEFASPLSVSELAGRAGLSRAHFIRAFERRVGLTPHRYLRARRITRACDLLVTTPRPVTEICTMVGFRSLGSFSAVFHRVTGESPSEWRRRRRRPAIIPGCFLKMHRVD